MSQLRWKKVSSGVYHATSPWGLYTIDGSGYGRNRWTVTYPDGDYGMVDALAEAKAWAENDAQERSRGPQRHHASRRHHITARARSLSQYPGAADWDVAMDALLALDPKRAAEVVRKIRKEPDRARESGSPAFEEAVRDVPPDVREKFFASLGVRTAHKHVDAIKDAIYRSKDPDALIAAVAEAKKHLNAIKRRGFSGGTDSSGVYDPESYELRNLLVDAEQMVKNIKARRKKGPSR